ncbi:DNA polymerase III subunit delta' [Enterobacter sp. Bisph1]|uniref:DNA polymerase III subunit delta' n=1 Tax=Enterobacter sp. Bisph1 TaxID=1274399 RepID=UPI00057BE799|nr:DNA polymerase III subunit delta' [Enterobacter sp. Bisph1]
MKWYPWLRPDFEQLVASYQSGRGHHALLIHALPGMGDEALIYAITRFLLCQTPDGHKSCGQCRGCQLMQAGTHPDYYVLAPEKGKSALGIDAVREVSEKLYDHARLSGAKVVWLADAASLTDAAANALLKTLEEPPTNTWFLLGCREPAKLLATLRSRCRLHHLAPPAEQYACSWLTREVARPQEALLTALRLCAGSPGAALALLQDDIWAQRQILCQAVDSALSSGDWLALSGVLNHDGVAERLQWLSALLVDALKLQQGVSLLSNVDALALVQKIAQQLSQETLHAQLHAIFTCREQLLSVVGVNRELLLTDLLLTLERYQQTGVTLPVSHL